MKTPKSLGERAAAWLGRPAPLLLLLLMLLLRRPAPLLLLLRRSAPLATMGAIGML